MQKIGNSAKDITTISVTLLFNNLTVNGLTVKNMRLAFMQASQDDYSISAKYVSIRSLFVNCFF